MLKTIAKMPLYRSFRWNGQPKMLPLNYVLMPTYSCNSRCKTCFIWKIYQKNPTLKKKELKIEEFDRIFTSIGQGVLWVTVGGGEPFLRKDIVQICELLQNRCSPFAVHILTNATLPRVIGSKFKKILEKCNFPYLKINLSLDGIGKEHDEIRGCQKNFKNFLLTYRLLKEMQVEIPTFKIGIHTTVSKYNVANFFELYDYAKKLNPDTFIFEIAQERGEFLNTGTDITPLPSQYMQLVNQVKNLIRKDYLNSRRGIPRLIQAFKLQYYDISAKGLQMKKQIIPCYGGFTSCQINPFGEVWPCAILADSKSFGNLRDYDYNFKLVWFSERAKEVRELLKQKKCLCPLACVFYTSAPFNFCTLLKIIRNMVRVE